MITMRGIGTRTVKRNDEEGFALIMVMGIGLVLMLLMATAVSLSVSNMQKARGDQNWSAAESAAYAGVADYEAKLANNNTYYLYGNPASTFSPTNTVVLPPATSPNPAFGIGASSATWATVPGGDGSASFRYEVDNTKYASTGIISLRSTGRVGGTMRSIVANVRQHGFVDYMYFTKFELRDPQQTNVSCVPTYDWQSTHSALCTELQFAATDVIDGPVHSNDTIKVCGSTFLQGLSSSNPVAPYYEPVGGSCAAAQFAPGSANQPKYRAPIEMPATNSQMKQEVRVDLVTVPNPGCLYTGPTSIVFNGNNTMTVKSPFTKATNLKADSAGALTIGSAGASCGPIGNVANGLGSVGGATIPVIQSNLIFVQDVPVLTTPSTDPNGWPLTGSASYPPSFTCTNTSTTAGWTFGTLAYPMAGESVPAATPAHYGCRKGDVYVNGDMQGKLTIAVDNYIYVTGNLKYRDASANGDMLGLVGNNAVWVWNPTKSDGTPLLAANREVDAAILSLNHTIQVQNYDSGDVRGDLTVYGALAQRYRGPVGLGTTAGVITSGYAKKYTYDKRLQYQAPPKFLSPVAATYGIAQLVEVSPPFKRDGSNK
jgi:hypothetical protein